MRSAWPFRRGSRMRKDDHAEALRLARAAADKEERVEKHPVTPGPLIPARELLGDILLAAQPAGRSTGRIRGDAEAGAESGAHARGRCARGQGRREERRREAVLSERSRSHGSAGDASGAWRGEGVRVAEIMSSSPVSLAALPRLPRDDGGPVFAEPWQANAFALAVKLSEQGHFTWKEWASALADTLKAAADGGEPDDGSRYYDHWLATLERLAIAKGLTDQETLVARKDAWIQAYRNTPHGRPDRASSIAQEA